MPLELAHDAGALDRVGDLWIRRIDVGGKRAFFQHAVGRIFECREHVLDGYAEPARERFRELVRVVCGRLSPARLPCDQGGIVPDRLAIRAPEQREGPTRQFFTRVPFSLAAMKETAGREAVAKTADQLIRQSALGRTDRRGVPFSGLIIVDRDKGRLAAHCEANVLTDKVCIDPFAQCIERIPSLIGERIGDAWRLVDARDLHLKGKVRIGRFHTARNRRCRPEMRRGRQRKVPLPTHQSRGRIESDPAGTRQINLGPGVQVGEVLRCARRPVERLQIGPQLDQVAGYKARREAEVAKDLHQKPRRVATGP